MSVVIVGGNERMVCQYEDGKGENQLSHNDVFHVFAVGDSHYLATTWAVT